MKLLILAACVTLAVGLPRHGLSARLLMAGIEKSTKGDSKIIGGTISDAGDFNYTVSIQQRGSLGFVHYCGGVIYDVNWIVTSAQCVRDGVDLINLRVVAGEKDFGATSGFEQIRGVTDIVISSRYNPDTYESDIAMMKLSLPLDLQRGVAGPAILPAFQGLSPAAGTNCSIAGWGAILAGGISAVQQQRNAPMTVVSNADCSNVYGDSVVTTMLCAINDAGTGSGPCAGDTGGPLMDQNGVVVGLISWGYGCAIRGYPSVYTKISFYLDWIAAVASN